MITVYLGGGLGNQMFQYAAARTLAARHRTNVRLDLYAYRKAPRNFDDPEGRPFALGGFALPGSEVAGRAYGRVMRHRRRIANPRLRRFVMPHLFKEKRTAYEPTLYDPDFEHLPDGTYLWGFFQSFRYFAEAATQIRADFTAKDPAMLVRVDAALRGIRRAARPLVSLHVRRGDYLRFEGLFVEPHQRRAAMDQFRDADFLVFSDDLAWCRSNVQGENVFYSPFESMLEDFWGMASCDHNIIANSTFSWWAAWLNPKPDRIVVAPARGEADDDDDFYPSDWRLV
jgi:hypothetical protein